MHIRKSAAVVGDDHHRALLHTIDPYARSKSKHERGDTAGRGQQAHLKWRCIQSQNCSERQDQEGDLGAETRYRTSNPQSHKVGVPPETCER